MSKRKADTSINGEVIPEVKRQLYPLRINQSTVIYVTKDKCNLKYKAEYIDRTNKITAR